MDIQYNLPQEIHVLLPCHNDDARDLIAAGDDHSVHVVQVTGSGCTPLASFHVGSKITALAWSTRTVSPSSTTEWTIELTAACADFGLHLLTKSSRDAEHVFAFGGGLSGHHGKVTDMTFCGGRGEDSARYVATVSDDKMLMVWDLHPTIDISSNATSPGHSPEMFSPLVSERPQPTAYVIPFPHPLTTVNSHPSSSKEFLVSDCRGSIFLIDWRSDPADRDQDSWHHSSIVEFIEPFALAGASKGHETHWSGSVAWHRDSPNVIGATYGPRFSIWDISLLHGGKPGTTGPTFPEGGHRFRWCQTFPEYFAISTSSPGKGATIHVHNTTYVHAQPTIFTLHPRPRFVRDFDFMALQGIPRIAAAVGRELYIFSIGEDA